MRNLYLTITLILGAFLFCANGLWSQKQPTHVVFFPFEGEQFGFDPANIHEWATRYDHYEDSLLKDHPIAVKSVGHGLPDDVYAIVRDGIVAPGSINFEIKGSGQIVRSVQKNDSTWHLFLPKKKFHYSLIARNGNRILGELSVRVYPPKTERVVIVPLVPVSPDRDSLERYLNSIFEPANLLFSVKVEPQFAPKEFEKGYRFDNPSSAYDRYTDQMKKLRDLYFKTHPNASKNANYLFIIPGFTNVHLDGYMVRNKAIGFIALNEEAVILRAIARQLGFGIGMLQPSWKDKGPNKGTTQNLMDIGSGIELTAFQWEDLRHGSGSYSFYDNYEDVQTNNGIVAYYFWEEDENGNIVIRDNDVLASLKRPYKKNFLSYHLDIDNILFQTLFTVFEYRICSWHMITFIFAFLLFLFLKRTLDKRIDAYFRRRFLLKFLVRISGLVLGFGLIGGGFILVDKGYAWFEVRSGPLNEMQGLSEDKVMDLILKNRNLHHKAEDQQLSELLVRKGSDWHMKRRKRVLYFDLTVAGEMILKCRFTGDKDSLVVSTMNYAAPAESHYMVFNLFNRKGQLVGQRVHNHVGTDIKSKLELDDPSMRILLMVNGYRPTSIGHTFDENFRDIRKKGFEYPNSQNLLYNFDRFDYWRPWQQIDLKFSKRINPSQTLYADGHFSVATSNHRSLINFSTLASLYPKRCSNRKEHHCYITKITDAGWFGKKEQNTKELITLRPNRSGFRQRYRNGRIAGRNLLQLLNEIPNRSGNDTLYIVAHSMGYAYALGMIDEIRGRINFGGFYIIAPENAGSGTVKPKEWKEVWQYGSNFNRRSADAPCLQDGVAPQVCAGGLDERYRRYIPSSLYRSKGFFDSHFVGYYTWIFDIPKGSRGYITQH